MPKRDRLVCLYYEIYVKNIDIKFFLRQREYFCHEVEATISFWRDNVYISFIYQCKTLTDVKKNAFLKRDKGVTEISTNITQLHLNNISIKIF